jgi:hypothetical protein
VKVEPLGDETVRLLRRVRIRRIVNGVLVAPKGMHDLMERNYFFNGLLSEDPERPASTWRADLVLASTTGALARRESALRAGWPGRWRGSGAVVDGRVSLVDGKVYWRPTPGWAQFDARDFVISGPALAGAEMGRGRPVPVRLLCADGSSVVLLVDARAEVVGRKLEQLVAARDDPTAGGGG